MRSKVRFNQEIDTLNTIQIKSNSDEAQIFKNMEILCKYYSKIHLVSYLHLEFINNMMLIIFILASFISGMLDTINYKDHTSRLNNIESPTLILWGKNDEWINVKFAQKFKTSDCFTSIAGPCLELMTRSCL